MWLGRCLGVWMNVCGMVGRWICERTFRSWRRTSQPTDICVAGVVQVSLNRLSVAELPSLPIYREISRKYSQINSISRSPAFDLQSPAKESVFTRIFRFCFGRPTVLPAVSHLRYTESAESSRAETLQDAYNRTFLIGQLTGSDYMQWPMETFVTYWVGISLAAFFRRGKCWRYNE